MMRYVTLFVVFLVVGCQTDKSFTIKGTVPGSSFNGEYVYMAPLKNFSINRVDSALITNSSFAFSGIADSTEIFVLRAQKPLSRFDLQDLLIVNEPGTIHVAFNENSSAGGTALNDSLQKWKQGKMAIDSLIEDLANRYRLADTTKRAEMMHKSDSVNQLKINFHFNFVKNNKGNIVGDFVFQIMGNSFSDKQKKEIAIQ
jgi:hypothetical protein